MRALKLLFLIIALAMPVAEAWAAEKVVGVIMSADIPFFKEIHRAFSEEMSQRGIKVEMLVQTPSPETVSWSNAARKLVAVNADVIVTYGAPVTAAAIAEASGIPVIFAGVFDPESAGVSGKKNVTGVSSKVPLIGIIKMLKEIAPFTKLGIVYNEGEKDTAKQAAEVEGLGGKFSFQPVKINVRRYGDAAKIKDIDALFITTSCAAQQCTDDVIGAARKLKIPTAAAMGGAEERGVILTVTADAKEQGREAAEILAKVLAGEKPASVPIRLPKKVNMVINLKEASALDIKVPFDLMSAATRVIK